MSQVAISPRKEDTFPTQLSQYEGQFKAALPAHIGVDKFKRVVLTAVNQTPDLLSADRKSLFNSAVKCAADGLLPDGREAALVIFKTKDRATDRWISAVQYMPMVRGIIKLVRQSGDIASIGAHIVYQGEIDAGMFSYELGDEERLVHTRMLVGERGEPVLVYAKAQFKDGTIEREVLTMADIAKIRAVSKSGDNGPWKQWPEEMMKKSAIRRLSKRLSLSPEVEKVVERDETEFDTMKRAALAAVPADPHRAAMEAITGPAEDEPEAETATDPNPDPTFDWQAYAASVRADLAKHSTAAALTKDWDEVKERLVNEGAPEDIRAELTTAYLEIHRLLPRK